MYAIRSYYARIAALHEKGVLDRNEQDYLSGGFHHLTRLVLRQQMADFKAGQDVSAYVSPRALSAREKDMLKYALQAIDALRQRVKTEFRITSYNVCYTKLLRTTSATSYVNMREHSLRPSSRGDSGSVVRPFGRSVSVWVFRDKRQRKRRFGRGVHEPEYTLELRSFVSAVGCLSSDERFIML